MTRHRPERRRYHTRLGRFVHHPYFTLFTGVLLLSAGVLEMLEELVESFDSVLQMHHAVLLFGALTVVRAVVEIAEGTERLGEVAEEES